MYIGNKPANLQYHHNEELIRLKSGELIDIYSSMMSKLIICKIKYRGKKPIIVPVPNKNWKPSSNGVELLAKGLAEELHYDYVPALTYNRIIHDQKSLSFQERLRNLDGAIDCDNNVSHRTVILVDDIMTTGTTMSKAANAVINHWATEVYGIVAARDMSYDWLVKEGVLIDDL